MTAIRILMLLVIATALPLGGCYVDAGPPGPAYGAPAPPHGYYGRPYVYRTYGHARY
ncbi:MAG TPA: hypothetical protein VGG39_10890 [Polyangiaceae bacterium]|jgi:hypothetical protein